MWCLCNIQIKTGSLFSMLQFFQFFSLIGWTIMHVHVKSRHVILSSIKNIVNKRRTCIEMETTIILVLQCLGSLTWQQSVASTLDTYLVIEDLIPGCQYQFRISASNPWGISSPSEPSDFVTLSCNNGKYIWVLFPKIYKENYSENTGTPWLA